MKDITPLFPQYNNQVSEQIKYPTIYLPPQEKVWKLDAKSCIVSISWRCFLFPKSPWFYHLDLLKHWLLDWFLVFNAAFSNISAISWWPVLVVEEAGVPGENHRTWASNWKTLSLVAASRVHPFCNPGGVFFFQSHHGFITWTCWIHYNFWVFFCLNKQGPGGSELDYLTTHTSLSPIRRGFVPGFVNYKKGALDSQPQVIKYPGIEMTGLLGCIMGLMW
jgi:hypothetical protein